ncbi:MAG: hypothetical protein NTY19_03955 [Planctomycetota bacterium]|nr:hypothetical protein [Planctomycetota bacterium]
MSRLLRPQFSLATLLIAMAWSAGVVWVNVTPRLDFSCFSNVEYEDNGFPSEPRSIPGAVEYGWPWTFALCYGLFHPTDELPRRQMGMIGGYRELAGDFAVGVLLVSVLTWGSSHLLQHVESRLRRRSASKLGEQPTLRSRGK